ncbi:endonuclease MutS2 [Alkaliphilus pronyensis]|uniref:Endonuclease MutS2 n=1 Tax=Alkaliphilus pronyensis TaxID=1482732 RepID=A0A6I0FBQ9_9FIRM|nr:endonuclease MutS2 [Alkaliphilus pronyensis]KAB3535395.1 endonuclease MutS2 [Alkaliphilus pronyensis]
MNKTAIELLEYGRIKGKLKEYTLSELGAELVDKLQPQFNKRIIETWLKETTEAKSILNITSAVPIHSLKGMDKLTEKFGKGMVLQATDLAALCDFLENSSKMKKFMKNAMDTAPLVTSYGLSIYDIEELVEEINRCIRGNSVIDKATTSLAKIRKKIAILEERMKTKLDSIVKSMGNNEYLQDNLVSVRDGRYVIPVKREHSKSINGEVLDRSNTGSTVFIEPKEVKKLQNQLNQMKIEEEQEEYKVLSQLTALAEGYTKEISINIEIMANYDFIFAKGKLSRYMEGNTVTLNNNKCICIKKGKHPLIGKEAVPLNFSIGDDYHSLVITGPNTGGKTVVLKTVGLMCMMVQSGLHVPVAEGSQFSIFKNILVDIGDGQSIEQSLSTFSSHLKNIIYILQEVSPQTLVIVDELGSGTDPGEGMGLAISILEALSSNGATTLATTHYSEIKEFADKTHGFENGCMEFDINSLKPTYKLKIGRAGESNGFLIALRLGMSSELIKRAHEITYKEIKDYNDYKFTAPIENEVQMPKTENAVKEKAYDEAKDKAYDEAKDKLETKKKVVGKFKVGDCVFISSLNRTGIVCEQANHKGEVGVMVMKKKLKINHKRLSLYIEGDELYPEDYDMDIVLESKENRKKKKTLSRKFVRDLQIHS